MIMFEKKNPLCKEVLFAKTVPQRDNRLTNGHVCYCKTPNFHEDLNFRVGSGATSNGHNFLNYGPIFFKIKNWFVA